MFKDVPSAKTEAKRKNWSWCLFSSPLLSL